jgi:hypothetical protein
MKGEGCAGQIRLGMFFEKPTGTDGRILLTASRTRCIRLCANLLGPSGYTLTFRNDSRNRQ